MKNFYTNVSSHGNYIYLRGFDDEGNRVHRREKYMPYLFHQTNQQSHLHDINGIPVKQKNFDSMWECTKWVRENSGISGMNIYGSTRFPHVYIYDNYRDCIPETKKINIVSLDIEVLSDAGFPDAMEAKHPITSISMVRGKFKIAISTKDFVTDDPNTYFLKCDSEAELLRRFVKTFQNLDCDVLTGWNTEFFDIPYLVNRCNMLLGEEVTKRLSPWEVITPYTVRKLNKEIPSYSLLGIACLDYYNVYQKFCLDPRDSYKLDYIAQTELGENKIDYSEYRNLNELWEKNPQKYIEYNIHDAELVLKIDKACGYFDQIFAIAYDAGVNYNDTLGSVMLWDTIIHNYLMDNNTVIPCNDRPGKKDRQNVGGFVKDPQVGMHEWVISFDLNSLYPSLIQQYNISPDTRVKQVDDPKLLEMRMRASIDSFLDKKVDLEYLKEVGLTMTPNGEFYKKDKEGFLNTLMANMYKDRVKYKTRMIELKKKNDPSLEGEIVRMHNLQLAKKVQLNSAYGACANQYFRWYDLQNAEAITMAGQLAIKWVSKAVNQYMNKTLKTGDKDYILAIDTDSIYVCFDGLVNKIKPKDPIEFLDKVAEEVLQPLIDSAYQDLAEYTNAYQQRMIMKRENIADKAIWVAKKRYIMNVYDSEGVRYEKPKLKMMGIEAIRSSTPAVCRDYIKNTLELIMSTNESTVQNYIKQAKEDFAGRDFEEVGFPRSVSFTTDKKDGNGGSSRDTWEDSATLYKKGTPIQVKGSLIYNKLVKDNNLENKYPLVQDGEKIKFCYLRVPNPIKDTVISCPNELPPEFGLEKYIDYDTQFEKAYLQAIIRILDCIGWKHEKVNTLAGWFN